MKYAVPPPPTNVKYVQINATTLNVSWSPPTQLEDVTGYMIYYSGSDGKNGTASVSNGWTNSYLLTGLQTGVNYSVSIVALSQHLPSEVISATEGAKEGTVQTYTPPSLPVTVRVWV